MAARPALDAFQSAILRLIEEKGGEMALSMIPIPTAAEGLKKLGLVKIVRPVDPWSVATVKVTR